MPRKVNRDTDAQYDYIRANYSRVYVRPDDHRDMKMMADRMGVTVVKLVTALLSVNETVISEAVASQEGYND